MWGPKRRKGEPPTMTIVWCGGHVFCLFLCWRLAVVPLYQNANCIHDFIEDRRLKESPKYSSDIIFLEIRLKEFFLITYSYIWVFNIIYFNFVLVIKKYVYLTCSNNMFFFFCLTYSYKRKGCGIRIYDFHFIRRDSQPID